MANIRDVLGLKTVGGDVGMEVEVEGTFLPTAITGWKVVPDGSLKSGLEAHEYVMALPVKMDDLKKVLELFSDCFKTADVLNSTYAGVHAHVNVQKLTPVELVNYIVCYIILEDLLVDWCGRSRVGNHFCLRTSDATYMLDFIEEMICHGRLDKVVSNDDIRYCSINLKAVAQYGSIEFRALESTVNRTRLHTWASVLVGLRDFSKGYETPADIIRDIRAIGINAFVYKALGDYTNQFFNSASTYKVRQGISRAQGIAFCKDWRSVSFNIFQPTSSVFTV